MTLVDIHKSLANTALLFAAIMAVWGLARFFLRRGVGPSYWGAVIIAEFLILIQGLLGVILWAGGAGLPPPWIHILYGVVNLLALPLVYFYTKGRAERPEMLLYSVAFLFLIGALLRAIETGV